MRRPPTSYWDYVKVEELTRLQGGLEPTDESLSNDEVLFITVHQIDELWFKLALRELVLVRDLFAQERIAETRVASAVRGIRRAGLLFDQASAHFALLETMTTRDYLAFRDKLSPASGFQSAQLREIEIVMGLPEEDRLPLGGDRDYMRALRGADGGESSASARVRRRLEEKPSLREAIESWLFRTPIDGSFPGSPDDAAVVSRFVERYLEAHEGEMRRALELASHSGTTPDDRARLSARFARESTGARGFLAAEDVDPARRERVARVRAASLLIESYRELPLLAWPREVVDALIQMEQAFVVFRQRHARMVERVIGRRTGTGGSAGVEYLDQTALQYRVFRDLWAVRTILIRADALPALERTNSYGLAVEP
jgi:tryptophan 2,3-dioxygenase